MRAWDDRLITRMRRVPHRLPLPASHLLDDPLTNDRNDRRHTVGRPQNVEHAVLEVGD